MSSPKSNPTISGDSNSIKTSFDSNQEETSNKPNPVETSLDPTPVESTFDPSVCPSCGRANGCAVTAGRPPETCWCNKAVFSEEALRRIPPELRMKACLCIECASKE
ncbi:cysteine-rich CWC family protein [Cohnella sp. AR92]|uniref:cysteine-rich CWC family protein n=1 Tax=Cohnella sp. AR92 TaxID=648716 RepID=UPI000F8E7C8F|nr:cysteine-rich CWC family protein [Cohnella sp. AR92]RUS45587.1 hypothetical protein ELR57_19775 [Cohnella sp. AR92]